MTSFSVSGAARNITPAALESSGKRSLRRAAGAEKLISFPRPGPWVSKAIERASTVFMRVQPYCMVQTVDHPRTFSQTSCYYNGYPAVLVRLAEIEPDELEDLLIEAWKCMAPK